MKKGKRLLILLMAVAVFGVGAYWLNATTKQQEAAKEAAKETEKTVLMTADTDQAATLTYTRGDETIDLKKKDGAWVYTPREAFALDETKVTDMLTQLTNVEAVRTVADTAESAADYGLDKPYVTVTLTDGSGTAQTLSLGNKNSVTGDYYAAVGGKTGVYTVSADVYNAFDHTLTQLLTEEKFPTVSADAVTDLSVKGGAEEINLKHSENGDASAYSSAFQWFAVKPDATLRPVNGDAVETYLNAATAVAYTDTATDTHDDLAAYGLDHPRLSITLGYQEEVPQSQAAAAMAEEAAAKTSADALIAATATQTPLPTETVTADTSATATANATPAATAAATATATATPTATATAKPTATATATATAKPTATATAKPTATATVTATAKPTATATATAKPTATQSPTPTAAKSGSAGMALAETGDAVPSGAPTDTPTAEPTATPEPTVAIARSITLWFGNADEAGNVYMTHSKTQRVFKVSAETYATLAGLTGDALKLSKPVNLALEDITGMTAEMGGVTKTIVASAETETAASGEQTVKTVYRMDGQELKTSAFSLFINNLKAIKAEAYTDQPVAQGATPTFTATFTQSRPGFETITVAFYPYDGSFEQALVNGDATMLVNKRDVSHMQTYFDELAAVAPTATPDATQAPGK